MTLIAEAAVLRINEVQLPQTPLAASDRGRQAVTPHRGEQPLDGDPLAGRAAGQGIATVWRRGLSAVRTFAQRWPLIASIRLISSINPWLTQRRHSCRTVPAAGLDNAARPRAVSWSRFPACSASPPAWMSSGQANAAIASWAKKSPADNASATATTVAAVGRRVFSLQRSVPLAHNCRTACTLACDSCSVNRTVSAPTVLSPTRGDLNGTAS